MEKEEYEVLIERRAMELYSKVLLHNMNNNMHVTGKVDMESSITNAEKAVENFRELFK